MEVERTNFYNFETKFSEAEYEKLRRVAESHGEKIEQAFAEVVAMGLVEYFNSVKQNLEEKTMAEQEGLVMKYFVLKPKGKTIHAEASRLAMMIYASSIEQDNPVLARELRMWVHREQEAAK